MCEIDKDEEGQKYPSLEEIMRHIYENNLWGGGNQDFYSGQGSHKQKIVAPYIEVVGNWLNSFEEKLDVCDLGCGDFNVGSQLLGAARNYTGVDVVEDLIQRNKRLFQARNLRFQRLDIVHDELPTADCAMVRQVLQHLSNEDILKVLPKLKRYRFLVVTEHLPFGEFVPNSDKPTDFDIRLRQGSGVVLTAAPFDLQPLKAEILLSVGFRGRSRIVTTLYQNF